jgi:hypothetical protein
MSDDFKTRLIQHARTAVERAPRAQSEAATSQYLVLPFFQLLGYDPLNPDEVVPEAHASFSDKFKNRVDYAISKDGHAVIAVECKKVGALNEGHRGELKGYFNAVPTVKLGVLTDGLVWQLYTDTGSENMMDDSPFVAFDLSRVAADGRLSEHAFDALLKMRRGTFDPAGVGADARQKLHVTAYLQVIEQSFQAPTEPLVRVLMDLAKMEGRRTPRLVEEHTPVVRDAMQTFLDRKILERIGFADRGDLVRVAASPAVPASTEATSNGASAPAVAAAPAPAVPPDNPLPVPGAESIVTTETEIAVFAYVRQRLPFLIERDEALYEKLEQLYPRDYQTRFTVCYRQDRSGRLFNFTQMTRGPKYRFEFPDTGTVINTDRFADIDAELLGAFMQRVKELG